MDVLINRILTLKSLEFNCLDLPNLRASANLTFRFRCNKICVFENGESRFIIHQTNSLIKILNALPPFNIESFTPYKCYANGTCCGNAHKQFFRPVFLFSINCITYELREHSQNICSLLKNQKQVALFKRRSQSIQENVQYAATYSKELSSDLLLMFCAFIDTEFYPNRASVHMYRKEVDFVPNDKFVNRTKWRPNNDDR